MTVLIGPPASAYAALLQRVRARVSGFVNPSGRGDDSRQICTMSTKPVT